MSFKEQSDFATQVADLNKYGQALNSCESVQEVVSLTLEAMSLLFEFPYSTFVVVRSDELRVLNSTAPGLSEGDEPGPAAHQASENQETVIDGSTDAELWGDAPVESTLAVPAVSVNEVTAVLVTQATTRDAFSDQHVRPLEILASHAATAISNIRSRERLERAQIDLARRTELIEMYDRLLRHDLRNDLQVIAGFANKIEKDSEGDLGDSVSTIKQTARESINLINRVGSLMSTLEAQDESTPEPLRPIVESSVETTTDQYERLSVTYDPESFEYRVYCGELLDSVISNLLSNAAVHNEDDVTVDISMTDVSHDTVTLRIADDGAGIPDAIRESLFEMGEKGPESEGTGFGLGFAKVLLESYGGSVELVDSDVEGADFRVTLERPIAVD